MQLVKAIIFSILLVCLCACEPKTAASNKNIQIKTSQLRCLSQMSECHFTLPVGDVELLFDVDKIIAEQSVNFYVNYFGEEEIVNVSGFMEGVDMFMGKIPVFLELQNNGDTSSKVKQRFQGELLFGSCSEQQMQWRMWLTFTTKDKKTHTKMVTLISHRS